jgi:hypothetical protein
MEPPAEAPSTRVHYMLAVVRSVIALGGAARPLQVYAWIADQGLRRAQTLPAGVDADVHYQREVRFARQELADGGILRTSDGAWRVDGFDAAHGLTAQEARKIIGDNRRRREARRAGVPETLLPASLPAGSAAAPRATTGPPPSSWEGTVTRVTGPASTYAFRFGTSDIWKIGFAADVADRLRQINQHVPTELLDAAWMEAKRHVWPSAERAYALEQAVLRHLHMYRTLFERVGCSEAVIDRAWRDAVAELGETEGVVRGLNQSFAKLES